jgi:exodeoxyribonuclease-3
LQITSSNSSFGNNVAFKIASWNVAGLRALVKKDPDALSNLCKKHDLDMLCLQETKLQESHVDDPKLQFRGCLKDDGYDDYWSCSTAKKGYSGTAVFVKQRGGKKSKQSSIKGFFGPKSDDASGEKESKLPIASETITPTEVSYNIGKEIDNEGRTVTLDFPFATITNVYVPNSGQTLQRLDYRTNEWDKDFLQFHQKKQDDRGLPVIWLGDLNIAHKAYDVWNDGAKHLEKQAGVTTQERVSFQSQLDAGFVDAFRKLHPETKGHYSYWSQRAGNREPNKGLRLDYFVCSPELFSEDAKVVVRDSYFIADQFGSDHCPAVLELEIRENN